MKKALLLVIAAMALPPTAGHAARPCEPKNISGGNAGVCVTRRDSLVACWGDSTTDWPLSRRPDGKFSVVSVGPYQSCGVRDDGTATCWRKFFEEPLPALDGLIKDISVGFPNSWALKTDGSIADAFGPESDPGLPVPTGPFLDIEGACGLLGNRTIECWDGSSPPEGSFEALSGRCGLRSDGHIQCWGSGATPPDGIFTQLSVKFYDGVNLAGCALDQHGEATCWGDEDLRGAPPSGVTLRRIAAAGLNPCGIRSDGGVECWPSWPDAKDGVTGPLEGTFTKIAAGGDPAVRPASCAIDTQGKLACWGNDEYGQTSPPDGEFVDVSVGPEWSCGIRKDGTIACWGDDQIKVLDAPAGTFTQVSAGGYGHSCAVASDGHVTCWGYNATQLYAPDGVFVQVVAGDTHSCALDAEGEVTCWEYDDGYTLADPPAGPFVQIATSGDHYADGGRNLTCGLRPNGKIDCWGDNPAALLVPSDGVFTEVSAGVGGACGLRSTGSIECWNDNGFAYPLFVAPEGSFVHVAAGNYHVCGLAADGSVVCAGGDQTVSFCGPLLHCGDGAVDAGEDCDGGAAVYAPGRSCTDGCARVPCGQPVHPDADAPSASDALFALVSAVGIESCDLAVCDLNASGGISVVDALAILAKSVGLDAPLDCPQ